MNIGPRLAEAVAAGIEWLQNEQDDDGSFLSYVSTNPHNFDGRPGRATTFSAALILGATAELNEAGALGELRGRLAEYLLKQRSAAWTFNYWPRDSEQSRRQPYPDDLDDTFSALSALGRYDPALVDGAALAAAVTALTLCESRVGGPYYTWIVPSAAADVWRDVDVGVNSNVAYFLAGQGVTLRNLESLMEEAIAAGTYTTPYYAVSPLAVVYFIARAYRGPRLEQLRGYVVELRDRDGWWGNPLDSALAVSAWLLAGGVADEVKPAVERILDSQQRGAWSAEALYVERQAAGATQYAGSAALTTALVLETLGAYGRAVGRDELATATLLPAVKPDVTAERLYEQVIDRVRGYFESLDGELGGQANLVLDRVLGADGDRQIGLLPYFWERSLVSSPGAVTPAHLVTLGAASVYGWLAYTIYDDFLDDEGKPPQLSVANVALRELTQLFALVCPAEAAAQWLVRHILVQIDEANTWEVLHCRAQVEGDAIAIGEVPDFGDLTRLAQRSLGHALGPVLTLLVRGCAPDDPAVAATLRFFRHYLIARQLNDDAHDMVADLSRGQINAVGAWVLRSRMMEGRPAMGRLELGSLAREMEERLWQHDIVEVCGRIKQHVANARQALADNLQMHDVREILALLGPLEAAAELALKERRRAKDFIAAYQETVPKKPTS